MNQFGNIWWTIKWDYKPIRVLKSASDVAESVANLIGQVLGMILAVVFYLASILPLLLFRLAWIPFAACLLCIRDRERIERFRRDLARDASSP